jgi:hypothetical protein
MLPIATSQGALLASPSQVVLNLDHWLRRGPQYAVHPCSLRGLLSRAVTPLLPRAQSHNRLAYCVAATYGRTFVRSASDENAAHPQLLEAASEDVTGGVGGNYCHVSYCDIFNPIDCYVIQHIYQSSILMINF